MFEVIIKNRYEEVWEYAKEHGDPYIEEPEFDRARFGNNVVHKFNNLKELYDLWTDAKKLYLKLAIMFGYGRKFLLFHSKIILC